MVSAILNGAGPISTLLEEEGGSHLVGAGRSEDIGEGENVNSAAGLEPCAPP